MAYALNKYPESGGSSLLSGLGFGISLVGGVAQQGLAVQPGGGTEDEDRLVVGQRGGLRLRGDRVEQSLAEVLGGDGTVLLVVLSNSPRAEGLLRAHQRVADAVGEAQDRPVAVAQLDLADLPLRLEVDAPRPRLAALRHGDRLAGDEDRRRLVARDHHTQLSRGQVDVADKAGDKRVHPSLGDDAVHTAEQRLP